MFLRSGRIVKMSKGDDKPEELLVNSDNKQVLLPQNCIHVMSILPSYDGESDSCQNFFELFSELADLAKWSDQERVTIVKSRLKGNALRYLVESPKFKKISFDELRKDFEGFFVNSQSLTEKHLSFNNIKLLPSEPIKTLAHRINTAVFRLMSDMTSSDSQCLVVDRLKLTKFIDALPAEYQREVLKLAPDCFDRAVELASKFQVALQSTQQLQCQERVNACLPKHDFGGENSGLERQMNHLQEQINALKIDRESYPSNRGDRDARDHSNEIVCFYCNRPRHTMAQCFIYRRDHLNVPNLTWSQEAEYFEPTRQNERRFEVNRGRQNNGRFTRPMQRGYSSRESGPRFQNPLNFYRSPR